MDHCAAQANQGVSPVSEKLADLQPSLHIEKIHHAHSYFVSQDSQIIDIPSSARGQRARSSLSSVFDSCPNTDIWLFQWLFPDIGSESNFWCCQFGRNARPRQRPDADPGPTRRKLLRSFQMTHLPRTRNFLGLQSSKEENHRDSLMIEANSSI
jgi:hypothetical protein